MVQKAQKHHFRVAGYDFETDKKEVEGELATLKPEPIRKVFVRVKKKKFPVKQFLAAIVPELPRSSYSTGEANRVARGLGFEVGEED